MIQVLIELATVVNAFSPVVNAFSPLKVYVYAYLKYPSCKLKGSLRLGTI